MEGTLRVRLRPIRLRFVRRLRIALLHWLRARMREESPVVNRVSPVVSDRSGFRIRGQL